VVLRFEAERRDLHVYDARFAPPASRVARDRNAHPTLLNPGPVPPQHRLLGELTDEADAVHVM
jgi:hypothetical protein